MSSPFQYHVSFRVTHPTLDAVTIAKQVGMTPKFSWTVGEPRQTPNGTPLNGTRDESYCTFDVGSGDDGGLAACVSAALIALEASEEFLHDVRRTGGALMIYAFWHPNGDTGAVFNTDALRRMAELGIELGINVLDDRSAD